MVRASTITSAASGPWSASTTWIGGVVPKDGDAVVIADGTTITVDTDTTVGPSASEGVLALDLQDSGSLVVASGHIFRVRGDVQYTSGWANTSQAVSVQAGATWRFDSSQAGDPQGTHYRFTSTQGPALRLFSVDGTAALPATVDADPNGGFGYFTFPVNSYGSPFRARFAHFARLGDASTPAILIYYDGYSPSIVYYDVTDSSFDHCGQISLPLPIPTGAIFRHSRNQHSSSQASTVLSVTAFDPIGSGTRELAGNVFDLATYYYATVQDFTILSNYFGGGFFSNSSNAWASWSGNFFRSVNSPDTIGIAGDASDTYVFIDSDLGNPHVLEGGPGGYHVDGFIMSQAGSAHTQVSDSGEWILLSTTSTQPYLITRTLMLADMYGYSSGEMTALSCGMQNYRQQFEHNVWFGGYNVATTSSFAFPALQVSECGNSWPHQILSFKSNIVWNPQVASKPAAFYKFLDLTLGNPNSTGYCPGSSPCGPAQDIVAPDAADYNAGWGYLVSYPNVPSFQNQGRGYAGNFSATPGAHDINADPMFVDWQRNVELFDSKYLGNRPPAWNAGATYQVGDFVSYSKPEKYWGLSVNLRYTNSTGCNSQNREPLLGSDDAPNTGYNNWRQCWEWASLYRLRAGVASQTTYTDASIGAQSDDVIMTLLKWVRAGYRPTNGALRGAAHDGTDIGAVPMFLGGSTAASVPAGDYVLTNKSSGMLLDDPASSRTAGTQIIQWPANGGANQKWYFSPQTNGYYTIQNIASGLFLTQPSSTSGLTKLEQQVGTYQDSQFWSLTAKGDGFIIRNKAGNFVIDDPGFSKTRGAGIILYQLNGGTNQIWTLQ